MVMRFEGHERAWKNGRDVRAQFSRNADKQARIDFQKEHKRGNRSYYANSAIATDDYWWTTRIQYLDKQGENILKFPRTFIDIHGRNAGAAPVLVRPFSPSIASESDGATTLAQRQSLSRGATPKTFKLEDNALESWGHAARLFNTTVDSKSSSMAPHMTLATTALNLSEAEFVDNYEKYEALRKVATAAASAAITHGIIKGGAKLSTMGSARILTSGRSRSRRRGRSKSPFSSYMAGITAQQQSNPYDTQTQEINLMQRQQQKKKDSIIQRREVVVDPIHCGGQVLKSHINSLVLGNARVNRGEVRRSATTAGETKIWHADEASEPVWKRIKRIPPIRNPKIDHGAADGATKCAAEQYRLFSYKRALALLAESVEAEEEADERSGPNEPGNDTNASLPGSASPSRMSTPALPSASGSSNSLTSRPKSVNFSDTISSNSAAAAVVVATAATATVADDGADFGPQSSNPEVGIGDSEAAAASTAAVRRQRPSSAPLALGLPKTQFNEYYYESVMMSNQKSSLLPRLKSEIDDVTVQPVPVDVHNVNELIPTVHFGYDPTGNFIALLGRSHQPVVRPSSASRFPLTFRERQAYVAQARQKGLLREYDEAAEAEYDGSEEGGDGEGGEQGGLEGFMNASSVDMSNFTVGGSSGGGGTFEGFEEADRENENVNLGLTISTMGDTQSSEQAASSFGRAERVLMRNALGATSRPWQGGRPDSTGRSRGGSRQTSRQGGSRQGSRKGSPSRSSPTSRSFSILPLSPSGTSPPGSPTTKNRRGPESPSSPSRESKRSPSPSRKSLSRVSSLDGKASSRGSKRFGSPGRPSSRARSSGGMDGDFPRRDRINVPMDIVHTPKMIISKTVDINLYNDVDREGPNEVTRAVEKKALIRLFDDTGGLNWINKTNWCSNVPLHEWHGVNLDARGFVCELKLSNNNLCGEFPMSIAQLKELEVLELDSNNFVGPIGDAALNVLDHLEVISLRHNQFDGQVPYRVFSFLRNLREVWLSCNKLSGHMHEAIGGMTSCTHLCLYDNQIDGEIPPQIGKLTKLEVLSLGKNKLHGELPETMRALERLSHLSLYQNSFSGPVPDWVEEMECLVELNLNFNNFSGYVPRNAKEMQARLNRKLKRASETAESGYRKSRESRNEARLRSRGEWVETREEVIASFADLFAHSTTFSSISQSTTTGSRSRPFGGGASVTLDGFSSKPSTPSFQVVPAAKVTLPSLQPMPSKGTSQPQVASRPRRMSVFL